MDIVRELLNGVTLYREENGAGGHRYWSDEVGGGVMVWDTSLVDDMTLLAAVIEETHRRRTVTISQAHDRPAAENWDEG